MAVGNNNGTYVPAHLRAAVEAPGFEEAARALRWDAPQAVRSQPDERSIREREERAQAQKTIENGLSSIRMALANPNLSDAQRAELSHQQSQLEGLQTQLTTGARSVDVAHVSAVASQVSSSVSAMVASVGMGASGSVQMAQIAAQAGVSVDYARSFGGHVVTNNMTPQQARETVFRGFDHTQRTMDTNNRTIVANGGQLAGTEEERARWTREEAEARQNQDLAQLQRVQQERLAAERRQLNEDQSAGLPSAVLNARRNNIQTLERRLDQIGRAQEVELNRQVADGRITPEQRNTQMRDLRERQAREVQEIGRTGNTALINQRIERANDGQHRLFARSETDATTNRINASMSFAVDSTSTASLAAALAGEVARGDERPGVSPAAPITSTAIQPEAATPTGAASAQQVASTDQAREAARPLAQNQSQSSEATQGQTQTPRTQTATNTQNTPATSRA